MENKDMEATEEKQETEAEEDFAINYGRFLEETRRGHYVEASVIQMDILLRHGVWVD